MPFLRSSLPLVACIAIAVATALCSCGTGRNPGFTIADAGGDDATATEDVVVIQSDSATASPTCDTSCGAAGGQCQRGKCVITENPGQVDANTRAQLEGGGNADPSFGWLYPYDKTVFPRGLQPPAMQFGGSAPDAVYVSIAFSELDYKGYFAGSNPGRVTLSPEVWSAITLAATGSSQVKVQVTKLSGGKVTGPIVEGWTIAQGSLRGTIYYETIESALAGTTGIMEIRPGAAQPTVLKSGCGNVCHTASADGSTLVANSTVGSASYDLKTNATIKEQTDTTFTYGALYPDGRFLMSATNYRTWYAQSPVSKPSNLYDTRTGAQIAAPGWDGVINYGGTPAFSPDGKHIAFNHEDTGGGHTLAVMDFDVATKQFTNLADIADDPATTLAWPAFTPDAKWVVYHAGSSTDFETHSTNTGNQTGDVFIVDLATKTTHRLDALDGYSGSGAQTYLPAADVNLSFAPTVLPVAVGGYYWVVFTSHRSYGNTLASRDDHGKLWVAAIDMSPVAGQDPSHPAFYLDGQEATAGNLRGFWVLSPCKAAGSTCASGDDCCDGFCRAAFDGGALQCVAHPGGCSNEYEKCDGSADCCDHAQTCINGRCASPR